MNFLYYKIWSGIDGKRVYSSSAGGTGHAIKKNV